MLLTPHDRELSEGVDADLVVRARRGDASAFSALVRKYLRAAISVALSVVHNTHDAEDLAQDAFVAALQGLGGCNEPDRFAAWLFRIVRNRALNRLAQLRVRSAAAEMPVEGVTFDAERAAIRQQLLFGLSKLTQVQREVVLLHDLESWTHAEIAAALELSEVSSRQHLFNARKALRALFTEAADG